MRFDDDDGSSCTRKEIEDHYLAVAIVDKRCKTPHREELVSSRRSATRQLIAMLVVVSRCVADRIQSASTKITMVQMFNLTSEDAVVTMDHSDREP